jgi:soluble lytic murein transglycosylase
VGTPAADFSANRLNAITALSESGNRDYQNGRPVTSTAGARFAMQVMPETARDPGFGLRPANPNDSQDMNRLGREYRATMERRYGSDPRKMWAAYNWGPGNLDKAIERYGERWLEHAPAETRAYIARNMRELRSR